MGICHPDHVPALQVPPGWTHPWLHWGSQMLSGYLESTP